MEAVSILAQAAKDLLICSGMLTFMWWMLHILKCLYGGLDVDVTEIAGYTYQRWLEKLLFLMVEISWVAVTNFKNQHMLASTVKY